MFEMFLSFPYTGIFLWNTRAIKKLLISDNPQNHIITSTNNTLILIVNIIINNTILFCLLFIL